MGVNLTSMGEVANLGPDCEIVSHLDPIKGVYKKLVLRDNKLAGAVLLGAADTGGRLMSLFKSSAPLTQSALDFLANGAEGADDPDALRRWPTMPRSAIATPFARAALSRRSRPAAETSARSARLPGAPAAAPVNRCWPSCSRSTAKAPRSKRRTRSKS